MKRLMFSLFFSVYGALYGCAQISTSVWYDGFWSEWRKTSMKIAGSYSSMVVYPPDEHPSLYQFKYVITNYCKPTKDELKQHRKSNEWFQYDGWVEYYVTDDYPTIEDVFRKFQFPAISPSLHRVEAGQTPCAKRTSPAIIKIKPYKDYPQIINILFDNFGFAIDMNGLYFNE